MRTKLIIIAIIAAAAVLCVLTFRVLMQSRTIDRMRAEAAESRREADALRRTIAEREAALSALTTHHNASEAIHADTQETREAIDTAAHDTDVKGYLETPIPEPLRIILRDRLCGVSNDTPE